MKTDNNTFTNGKPLLKGWIRGLLIIIPSFFVAAFFQEIGYLVLKPFPDINSSLQTMIIQGISLVGILLLVFFFIRYLDRTHFKSLGLQTKGCISDILLGIVLGSGIMLLGFIILFSMNEIIVTDFNLDIEQILIGAVLFVFVAFNEEILVRGYILNNFLQSMNKYLALALSSLIFSALHLFNPDFNWVSFVSIFLAGILLGIPYIYTKNLWFPIALHFSWNFFQGTFFGFRVSGQSTYSIICQAPSTANNIINGGNFGFEGSIISHIFIIVSIIIIWLLVRKS